MILLWKTAVLTCPINSNRGSEIIKKCQGLGESQLLNRTHGTNTPKRKRMDIFSIKTYRFNEIYRKMKGTKRKRQTSPFPKWVRNIISYLKTTEKYSNVFEMLIIQFEWRIPPKSKELLLLLKKIYWQ